MGAEIIFPDIDPTEALPSKEKVIAVGDTMVEPLPSTETLPSKEKVIEVGATISEPLPSKPSKENIAEIAVGAPISEPLPSKENIAKYPDEANPEDNKVEQIEKWTTFEE